MALESESSKISWREYIEHFLAYERSSHQSSGLDWFSYQGRDGWKIKVWFPTFIIEEEGKEGQSAKVIKLLERASSGNLSRLFGLDGGEGKEGVGEVVVDEHNLTKKQLLLEINEIIDQLVQLQREAMQMESDSEFASLVDFNKELRGLYMQINTIELILNRLQHLNLLGHIKEGPRMMRKR